MQPYSSYAKPKDHQRKIQGLTRKKEMNNYPSKSRVILTDKLDQRQIHTSHAEIGDGFATEGVGFENNSEEKCNKKLDLHPPLYIDQWAPILQRRKLKKRTDSLDDEDDVNDKLREKALP